MKVSCLRHNELAKQYRLVYPQPPETPPIMLWEPPGPSLWMCEKCSRAAGRWVKLEPHAA